MEKDIPVMYLDFDEEDMGMGMSVLSFVKNPAVEVKWEIFQSKPHNFRDFNDEKRLVTAPVMIAETKIPRFSPEIGKYFVKFSKQTIEKMMKKYFKENKIHLINTDHDSTQKKDGVYMMESFIVGDRTESKLFPELPDGSWVATYYVENDSVWEEIKNGNYQGFSLEGFFIEKYENEMFDKIETQLREIVYSNDEDEVKEQKIKDLLNIV